MQLRSINDPGGFLFVTNAAADRLLADVSPHATKIYIAMCRRDSRNQGVIEVRDRELEQQASVPLYLIRELVTELERAGLVRAERSRGKVSTYRLARVEGAGEKHGMYMLFDSAEKHAHAHVFPSDEKHAHAHALSLKHDHEKHDHDDSARTRASLAKSALDLYRRWTGNDLTAEDEAEAATLAGELVELDRELALRLVERGLGRAFERAVERPGKFKYVALCVRTVAELENRTPRRERAAPRPKPADVGAPPEPTGEPRPLAPDLATKVAASFLKQRTALSAEALVEELVAWAASVGAIPADGVLEEIARDAWATAHPAPSAPAPAAHPEPERAIVARERSSYGVGPHASRGRTRRPGPELARGVPHRAHAVEKSPARDHRRGRPAALLSRVRVHRRRRLPGRLQLGRAGALQLVRAASPGPSIRTSHPAGDVPAAGPSPTTEVSVLHVYDKAAAEAVSGIYAHAIVPVEVAAMYARKYGICVVTGEERVTGYKVREAGLLGELLGTNMRPAVISLAEIEAAEPNEHALVFYPLDELPTDHEVTLDEFKALGYQLELCLLKAGAPRPVSATPPAPILPPPADTPSDPNAPQMDAGTSVPTTSAETGEGTPSSVSPDMETQAGTPPTSAETAPSSASSNTESPTPPSPESAGTAGQAPGGDSMSADAAVSRTEG